MSCSIRKAIRKRNRFHYRAKHSNNPDHWKQYRRQRNEVIRLVRRAKSEYKEKLTSQLVDKTVPPVKWWRIARAVCKEAEELLFTHQTNEMHFIYILLAVLILRMSLTEPDIAVQIYLLHKKRLRIN